MIFGNKTSFFCFLLLVGTLLELLLGLLGAGLFDAGLHCRVVVGELADGQVIGLVVRRRQVVGGDPEALLDLREGLDGRVDALDGLVVLLLRVGDVLGEAVLEGEELVLELGEVHALVLRHGELLLVGEGLLGGLDQEGDDGDEVVRADDVHLLIPGHGHDAVVVQVVVHLQHGDEHGELAVLLLAVLVQFVEVVGVLLLAGGGITLVFHFEHDRDVLNPVLLVAEDEVSLGPLGLVAFLHGNVVLGEGCVGHHRKQHLVVQGVAMLLQVFAEELYGTLRLEVFVQFDLLLQALPLHLVGLQDCLDPLGGILPLGGGVGDKTVDFLILLPQFGFLPVEGIDGLLLGPEPNGLELKLLALLPTGNLLPQLLDLQVFPGEVLLVTRVQLGGRLCGLRRV